MKIFASTTLLLVIALSATAQVGRAEGENHTYAGFGTVCTAERGSSLSVRSGSGKNYRVLTQIRDKNAIKIYDMQYGKDGFRWLFASANGIQGWVRADYICGYDRN